VFALALSCRHSLTLVCVSASWLSRKPAAFVRAEEKRAAQVSSALRSAASPPLGLMRKKLCTGCDSAAALGANASRRSRMERNRELTRRPSVVASSVGL
jgi:hypothetical protein